METKDKMATKEVIKKFKSHYVVWKLLWAGALVNILVSLNRTMQYGNESIGINASGVEEV